jgi:putative N6-adenine-specific DNA methylase
MAKLFHVPCPLGLEPALAAELRALGVTDLQIAPGSAEFEGDHELGLRCCLWLRSAIRVQEILYRFPADSRDRFYDEAYAIDWPGLFDVEQSFRIDAHVRDSRVTHSKFAALVLKDAIVDRFRDAFGRRPNVERQDPDLPLRLHIREDEATVSRDYAGDSLHKRGYRPVQVKAPLSEAIAAGLLLLTGWDQESPLVDPMCGSGTIVIEAAMLASRRAPGLMRHFAFERWREHDRHEWQRLRDEARSGELQDLNFELLGGDRHRGAIEIARRSARSAGVDRLTRFECADVSELVPGENPRLVISNPPYGERIGRGSDLEQAWRSLGSFLHDRAQGADAWVLSGDRVLTKQLGLKARRRIPVHNARIECRLLGYPIGSDELHFVPLDQSAEGGDLEEGSARGEELPRTEEPVPAGGRRADAELDEEARRRACRARQKASPWVLRALRQLEPNSLVLDLACGHGRHTRALVEAGHEVVAIDKDLSQLGELLESGQVAPIQADLEGEDGGWPLEDEQFDAIVVTNYLWRPLFGQIFAALNYGGLLIYETFADGQEDYGRPRNPEHLLRESELLELCQPQGTVLAFEQGVVEEPEAKCVQRIVLRREPPSL